MRNPPVINSTRAKSFAGSPVSKPQLLREPVIVTRDRPVTVMPQSHELRQWCIRVRVADGDMLVSSRNSAALGGTNVLRLFIRPAVPIGSGYPWRQLEPGEIINRHNRPELFESREQRSQEHLAFDVQPDGVVRITSGGTPAEVSLATRDLLPGIDANATPFVAADLEHVQSLYMGQSAILRAPHPFERNGDASTSFRLLLGDTLARNVRSVHLVVSDCQWSVRDERGCTIPLEVNCPTILGGADLPGNGRALPQRRGFRHLARATDSAGRNANVVEVPGVRGAQCILFPDVGGISVTNISLHGTHIAQTVGRSQAEILRVVTPAELMADIASLGSHESTTSVLSQ